MLRTINGVSLTSAEALAKIYRCPEALTSAVRDASLSDEQLLARLLASLNQMKPGKQKKCLANKLFIAFSSLDPNQKLEEL